jgi:disulfide bond formation protein DsbB
MTVARLLQPKSVAILIAVFSLAALSGAYGSQYFGGLTPCPLCLYQRPPHWIAAGLAALALVLPGRNVRTVCLLAAAASLATGTGIAVFHVGVEQHWWGGLAGCSGPASQAEELEALTRAIEGTDLGRCDQIPWSLFGLSMAAYNAALSAVLALIALIGGAASIRAKLQIKKAEDQT